MVWLSNLQRETLLLVDEMTEKGFTFDEVACEVSQKGYSLVAPMKNGYISKTILKLYKRNEDGKEEYSFVDIKKRRNGLAYWETIKIS